MGEPYELADLATLGLMKLVFGLLLVPIVGGQAVASSPGKVNAFYGHPIVLGLKV